MQKELVANPSQMHPRGPFLPRGAASPRIPAAAAGSRRWGWRGSARPGWQPGSSASPAPSPSSGRPPGWWCCGTPRPGWNGPGSGVRERIPRESPLGCGSPRWGAGTRGLGGGKELSRRCCHPPCPLLKPVPCFGCSGGVSVWTKQREKPKSQENKVQLFVSLSLSLPPEKKRSRKLAEKHREHRVSLPPRCCSRTREVYLCA